MSEDIDKRKLLSALAHGSIFFSALVVAIGIPIAILFITDDDVTKENAREALNFHFNLFLYGIIFGILVFLGIGIILLGILWIVSIIMPIIAILQVLTNPYKSYRYPFIFRIL